MMTHFPPNCYLSRNIGRLTFASLNRTQRFSDVAKSSSQDAAVKDLGDNWKTGKDSSAVSFKNISLVTPRTFAKFFYNEFKLKFVEEKKRSKPGVELLRNIAANYDYWMIRNNQEHLLYYKIEMMLQRLEFLKTVGLDSRQKLRQIQKSPPALLFTFTDCSYSGKLVYLRGLLHKEENVFIHLLHPVTNKITANKVTIKNRVKNMENLLQIKQPAAIRELINMPCFFLDPVKLRDINHLFVHKYSMPFYYDVDKHTAPVFPPICNLDKLGLSHGIHLHNTASNDSISSLPTYDIADLLDLSYPTTNGRGNPECLSSFLVRAEFEEEKDRTGGQPLKGRRGFNVPPRQY